MHRMPLTVGDLPAIDRKSSVMDEEMFTGPRPLQPDGLMPVKFPPAAAAGRPHKLLLVHGYCSGDVWGPVQGQFKNGEVFLDLEQNRTVDKFAEMIGKWARDSGWGSFAIVAHSQGGMAALQLFMTRWSGLDMPRRRRLIQSVGTPYQGTRLAGVIAMLGRVFGGCGSNYGLTYEGAAQWLAGIPASWRGDVNYYTTSFKDDFGYDYCHIATDGLLSDPDDGVVEMVKGQLPGAWNRGHKTGGVTREA